jgi:cysteine desulfurase
MFIYTFKQKNVRAKLKRLPMNTNLIYFDNNSTTKVDDRVLNEMIPFFTEHYGNAASNLHAFGWQAKAAVNIAKEKISSLINCEPDELILTSGATEAVNLAIKGICEAYHQKGNHIVTCVTEHKAVLDTCEYLEKKGARITYLKVDKEGLIDLEELKHSITPHTILVSLMSANNETGVMQKLEEISEICKQNKIIFFSDATQTAGKQRIDLSEGNIDCMAFSAHKFYGPKGIGALYVKRKNPRVSLIPQIHGGGHQDNKRSGTLNVPLIVGFGKAAELGRDEQWDNSVHISKLKNYFEHQLLDINGLRINGSTRYRLYTTSNIHFPKEINVSSLFTNFAFSHGSACSSESTEPSHVLKAMGLNDEDIKASYRFSFGKYNNLDEVKLLVEKIMEMATATKSILNN